MSPLSDLDYNNLVNQISQLDARLKDTDMRVSYLTTQYTNNNNELTKALQVISERSIVTQDRFTGFVDSYKEYRVDISKLLKQLKEDTDKQTRELKEDHARQIESLKKVIESNKVDSDRLKLVSDDNKFTIRSWQGNLAFVVIMVSAVIVPTLLFILAHYWK